jgi:signal transduction histidine kinase/DNA-binding response OmpR family regulator
LTPFTLTALETASAGSAACASQASPSGSAEGLEVLVVDDTERNLTALEAILSDLDARVVKARSGAEALRFMLRQDFALVLLDVRMPGMNGFETAELIRARDRSRQTPIIFLTAYDRTREQEVQGYALGAVDFLSKPVIPEVLRGKVSVLIDLHRKTEEIRRQEALLRESEQRERAQLLEQARRRWEQEAMRNEMERERRAAEALHRSNARLRLLSEVASDLLLHEDLSSFPARLFPAIMEHLAVPVCLCHRAAGPGQPLALDGQAGLSAQQLEELARAPADELVFSRAASTERLVVAERAGGGEALDPLLRVAGLTACACFPLVAGGRLHGVLTIGTARQTGFESEELAVMSLLCDQAAAALERARLVDELRRSASELREADARKDEFLAMLGHELRNPLAPVLNAVKLMQQMSEQAAPPDASPQRVGRRAVNERGACGGAAVDELAERSEAFRCKQDPLRCVLEAADRQIAHMTRLLDDLLDVSRIRNGKIELQRGPVELARVVLDAVHATEGAVRERGHQLELSLPEEPVAFLGDPVRLTQVVANLLNNAAKYTGSGGRIALRARREGGQIVLLVKDDGIGIAPEMLERIFEMFVQGEQTADRVRAGLGLGLTLVRNLVEMHGGTVVARSEGPGAGSEFEVRLPAEPVPQLPEGKQDDGPEEGRGDGPSGKRTARPLEIVVVEDNADIRDTLKALLELKGHKVEEAGDGRSGVDLILSRCPSVALVDIGLPGLDGYHLARELRARPMSTRLVAMTGYGRPEDRRLALEAGFDAHLVKPVDFDDLTRLLDELP